MRWLLLLPFLVGCSQSEVPDLQQSLDRYAELSSRSGSLESVLTGDALKSAQQSFQLLTDLKITQRGLARFEVLAAENGVGAGCLDLADVDFLNANGELIRPARQERVLFQARYQNNFMISSLVISEDPC